MKMIKLSSYRVVHANKETYRERVGFSQTAMVKVV